MFARTIHILSTGYNCEEYLEECYQSVARDTGRPKVLWVLDDASIDNTWRLIQKLEPTDTLQIRPFHLNENMGSGYSRFYLVRQIMRHCQPQDIVIQLDLDDYLMGDALGRIHGVYDKHPSCMMTLGNFKCSQKLVIGNYNNGELDSMQYIQKGISNKFKPLRTMSATMLPYIKYRHMILNDRFIRSATDFAMMISVAVQLRAVNIRYLSDFLYYYRDRPDSTRHTAKHRNATREGIKEQWRRWNPLERRQNVVWANRTI